MVEALRVLLELLVVASVLTIAVYVVVFVALATWTVLGRGRRNPLAGDLDRALDEILGRSSQARRSDVATHGGGPR